MDIGQHASPLAERMLSVHRLMSVLNVSREICSETCDTLSHPAPCCSLPTSSMYTAVHHCRLLCPSIEAAVHPASCRSCLRDDSSSTRRPLLAAGTQFQPRGAVRMAAAS